MSERGEKQTATKTSATSLAPSPLIRRSRDQYPQSVTLSTTAKCTWADEADPLSTLIGEIYDAALDATLWPAALDSAASFVGGRRAALCSKDAVRKSCEFYYGSGCVDPQSSRLYCEEYVRLDPTMTRHLCAQICEPMATDDLIPNRELVETRFYQEWARPQGLAYGVSAVLDKAASSAVLFGVFRDERDSPVDLATKQRMRLVVPHIRRATMVGRAIELTRSEAATLADTLDGIKAGVFLVDAAGRLLYANGSGRRILARGDILRTLDSRIAVNDPQAAELLREAFAAAAHGDVAVGAKGVAVSLTTPSGARYVAHVLPLTGGERRRAGANYSAACALFVRETAVDSPSQPGIIASSYKLTPTELRVLLAIVDVGGVPEVAEALGVAESTVKTHLGRLYGKTGAGRQADLVKLVAAFSSPLLN